MYFIRLILVPIPESKRNKQTGKENVTKTNHIVTTPRIKYTRDSQKHGHGFSTTIVSSSYLEWNEITTIKL